MGFLRQNIKITNERLKNAAYKTSLQPVPEYASPVWDPFTANNIKALEKFQKTTKDLCVDTMQKQLHWPTLGQHRKQACLTTVYKFHHGLIHTESKHCPSSTNCPRRTTQHIYIYTILYIYIPMTSHMTYHSTGQLTYRRLSFLEPSHSETAFHKKGPQHPSLAPL